MSAAREHEMNQDAVSARALVLAEQFLAGARVEIGALAAGDIQHLHASAKALRAAAANSSRPAEIAEHVAYLVVAAAFNQAVAVRGPALKPSGDNADS